jgi:hypothetical protein
VTDTENFPGNKSGTMLFNEYKKTGKTLPSAGLMNMNCLEVKVVSPQGIPLNGSGPAIFTEQSACFSVQVPIGFLKNWRDRNSAGQVQVWLLKHDGTIVPEAGRPFVFAVGTAGDYARDYQFHSFSKVPATELASVIVNCHGKLYCHEIKKL